MRIACAVLLFLAPVFAEAIPVYGLDGLIEQAKSIVEVELRTNRELRVTRVFLGDRTVGDSIAVTEYTVPRIPVGEGSMRSLPQGTRLLLFESRESGQPIVSGIWLVHQERVHRPQLGMRGGSLHFAAPSAESSGNAPPRSLVYELIPERMRWLRDVRARLDAEPDGGWLLERLTDVVTRPEAQLLRGGCGLHGRLWTELEKRGTIEQVHAAFVLPTHFPGELAKRLGQPEAQPLLLRSIEDESLPAYIRIRCVRALAPQPRARPLVALVARFRDDAELAARLLQATGRSLVAAEDAKRAAMELVDLHESLASEPLRYRIACALRDRPAERGRLTSPCAACPSLLRPAEHGGGRLPRVQVEFDVPEEEKFQKLTIALVLAPIRGGAGTEVDGGALARGSGLHVEHAFQPLIPAAVPAGRYWAFARVRAGGEIITESYGFVLAVP